MQTLPAPRWVDEGIENVRVARGQAERPPEGVDSRLFEGQPAHCDQLPVRLDRKAALAPAQAILIHRPAGAVTQGEVGRRCFPADLADDEVPIRSDEGGHDIDRVDEPEVGPPTQSFPHPPKQSIEAVPAQNVDHMDDPASHDGTLRTVVSDRWPSFGFEPGGLCRGGVATSVGRPGAL